ncbi:hypothetical protein B1759_12980 [Rubrivirga sp. SAORIC476]|uniref:DUF429 domain-containing protein n=1 Tax=Rubrivirga sp. SAORIC476 TaxID=1961794 RepID=UPI000BA97955|nr:DUF429 domain-containing protein [Rubrivirga sp. SAORIC476]PAP79255.1 hypothetical protein B1759_12980 [Rubrivirga sp. SAORIC476]
MALRIVGIDCATQPKNTGLALAVLEGDRLTVHHARVAAHATDAAETAADWLADAPDGVLALDAPLGWPAPMGKALASHTAGAPISTEADRMFNRATDRVVRQRLGKKPLEVGADRIARTALVALATLDAVRRRVPVAMGWTPGDVCGYHALEVYPAATLLARGLDTRGYKRPDASARRAALLSALDLSASDPVRAAAEAVDHALDAVLCCVAAADYARGRALTPAQAGVDDALARREGWIWFPAD